MEFAINKNIMKDAGHCRKNFSCLSGDKECLCDVEELIGRNALFIKPKDKISACNYRLSFGNAYVCNCPIRREIYNQYKI